MHSYIILYNGVKMGVVTHLFLCKNINLHEERGIKTRHEF